MIWYFIIGFKAIVACILFSKQNTKDFKMMWNWSWSFTLLLIAILIIFWPFAILSEFIEWVEDEEFGEDD